MGCLTGTGRCVSIYMFWRGDKRDVCEDALLAVWERGFSGLKAGRATVYFWPSCDAAVLAYSSRLWETVIVSKKQEMGISCCSVLPLSSHALFSVRTGYETASGSCRNLARDPRRGDLTRFSLSCPRVPPQLPQKERYVFLVVFFK